MEGSGLSWQFLLAREQAPAPSDCRSPLSCNAPLRCDAHGKVRNEAELVLFTLKKPASSRKGDNSLPLNGQANVPFVVSDADVKRSQLHQSNALIAH